MMKSITSMLLSSEENSNMMENGNLGSSKGRASIYFDAMDKAHELLEDYKDLTKAIPSCVVVGMQSVGKSAVLSRMSGIPFPQDSEVCTRVAIELRLRRRCTLGENAAGIAPMKITAGDKIISFDSMSNKNIENALKEAQTDVLKGREFEDKVSVKIDKSGPNLPEVTLVDLPGVFFAKKKESDELVERVTAMIHERVNNNMALICHVIPVNQDTDTISTWRIVKDADKDQGRTISILTKADLALKDGKESLKARLRNIVNDNDSSSTDFFVVHGAAADSAEEENQLASVEDCIEELRMGDRVLIGMNKLIAHTEERMLLHIKQKVPEMRNLLEAELQSCKDGLVKVGREPASPLAIALRDTDLISSKFNAACKSNLPKFRKTTEKMSNEIFDIAMSPLGLVDYDESRSILKKNFHSSYINHLSDHEYRIHAVAMEVKQLEEDTREHLNIPFVGKEEELNKWNLQFSEPCHKIIKQYTDDVIDMFLHDVILPSVTKGCSDSTKPVEGKVIATLQKIVADRRSEAQLRATEVYESIKTNAFTTNSHYLTESADAVRSSAPYLLKYMESPYAADMKPHFDTVFNITGFLKTRKKFVPEAMHLNNKRIIDELIQDTKEAIRATMVEESSLDVIKEPGSVVRKRKLNLDREKQIEKVVGKISAL